MISRLDRYVLRRAAAALILIVALVVLLVIGLDVILRLKVLLGGDLPEGTSRIGLVLRLYLYSLPTLISPLLPLAVAAAAVMTCAPMLKRGEFTALAASGVSLRVATRGVLLLAILVGCIDVFLSDQLAPRWEHQRAAIEDQLGGTARSARIWRMEDTGTVWYANKVILRAAGDPDIQGVVVAPPGSGLIHARALVRRDGAWHLDGPVLRWEVSEDGQDRWRELDGLPVTGALALPNDVAGLTQRLVSRHALTGGELVTRGGHLNRALFAGRYARLALPVAAVLLVLPLFVRFSNRDHLVVAALRALIIGLLPVLVVATGALSADSSRIEPLVVVGTAVLIALVPGILVYWRWRI